MLALLLSTQATVFGQIPRARVNVLFLGVEVSTPIDADTLRILENRLIASMVDVARVSNYSIIIPSNRRELFEIWDGGLGIEQIRQNLRDAQQVDVQGIVKVELDLVADNYFITAQVQSIDRGTVLLAESEQYTSFEQLIDRGPQLVQTLFEPNQIASLSPSGIRSGVSQQQDITRQLSLSDIAGRWQGDRGIEGVTIFEDGVAIASLQGNESFRLRVSLERNEVRVVQDEPNSPKLYIPLVPFSIASQLVSIARPMSWIFELSDDNNTLLGTKYTTYYSAEQGRITSYSNDYTREARWERIRD